MNPRPAPLRRRPGRFLGSWRPAKPITLRSPVGIAYLAAAQGEDGLWSEPFHTATGFPRVFYLRYHGYSKFFPLWAMARYRNLKRGNSRTPAFGM